MTDAQKGMVLVGGIAVAWLIHLLSPVLVPFMVAALLAYLGDPMVDKLERWKCSRLLAVVIVFAVMLVFFLVALLILVPAIERQVIVFGTKLPEILNWLEVDGLPLLQSSLGLEQPLDFAIVKQAVLDNWQGVSSLVQKVIAALGQSGAKVVAWVANLLLIPVVVFYLLKDWDILVANVHALIPRQFEPKAVVFAKESDEVLGSFLKGQLIVMAALGVMYAIGLMLIGLDFALLIGLFSGLASIVPYLGVIVGVVLASVAALFQFQDIWMLVWVGLVFGIGQMVEGMVLSPLLVGDKIGLHPVAVIFAVLAGGQLFGFFGVLLALPVAAVIKVFLHHAKQGYINSQFYGRAE